MTTMPGVGIELLDTPTVRHGEATYGPAELGGRRAVLCLAVLALQPGRSVSRQVLADAIWVDAVPPSWRPALRGIVSMLRRVLPGDVLRATADGYLLDVPRDAVDVLAMERHAAEAESADAERAWELAAAALPPFGAVALRGFDGPWSDGLRAGVQEVRRRLMLRAAEAALELGRFRDAERLARELTSSFPLREDGHRLLMRALVQTGNRGKALAAYEECRRLLDDALGTPPAPETEAVFLELLRTPPRLTLVPAGPAPVAERRLRRAVSYALTAAQAALEAGIYDDAARAATRGLAALDAEGEDADASVRLQLQIVLGAASHQLGDPEGSRILHRALADARARGDALAVADAALAFTAEGATIEESLVDDSMQDVYRAALESLPADQEPRRARLLGGIASALAWRRDGGAGRAAALQALEWARASGDPAALLSVLSSARQTVSGALDLDSRRAIDDELASLAEHLDHPVGVARAAIWRFVTAIEAGADDDLEGLLDIAGAAASESSSAAVAHTVAYHRAALALIRGDFHGAGLLAEEAASIGRRGGNAEPVVELVRLVQMLTVWEGTGRLERHRQEIVTFFAGFEWSEWSSVIAYVEAAVGDPDVAREHLHRFLDGHRATGPTMISPVALLVWVAHPVAALADAERAAELYPLLLPHSGKGAFLAHFTGPVDLALGLLAETLGDASAARRHFAAGAAFASRLGAPIIAARCRSLSDQPSRLRRIPRQADAGQARATGTRGLS